MANDRRQDVTSLKQRLVERWVARRLGEVGHERRVARIATTLVGITSPLHTLGTSDLRLLQMSAAVHDVGRAVDKDEHPVEGARMLQNDTWLPFSPFERRSLAYLTLYHRGNVPECGRDDILESSDPHRQLRNILAFLRAADALDSRSLESPRLVFALRGRRLMVDCYLNDDSAKARKVYSRVKKFRLLEEVLHVNVEVTLRGAEVLQMVA